MPSTANNEDRDFTDVVRVTFADLQRAGYLSTIGAANQRKVGTIQPGGAVNLAAVIVGTPLAGATDITIDLGVTAADPDDFIDNVDLDGLTKANYNNGDALTVAGDDGTVYVNNSTSPVNVLMEVNGTIANLTAGEFIVAWKAYNPNRFFQAVS